MGGREGRRREGGKEEGGRDEQKEDRGERIVCREELRDG